MVNREGREPGGLGGGGGEGAEGCCLSCVGNSIYLFTLDLVILSRA